MSVETTLAERAALREGTCPECGADVDDAEREVYCPDCGLVVERDELERRPQPGRRVEAVDTERHDGGLGNSVIGYTYPDGTHANDPRAHRLRRWNRRIQSGNGRQRSLHYAIAEAKRIGAGLELDSSTVDLACQLLRSASKAGLFKGCDLDGYAAGAVLIGCRVNDRPYGRAAIRALSRNPSRMAAAYDRLRRELDVPIPPASPSTYVPRIADGVDASIQIRERAVDLADALDGSRAISGRKPQGVAAACVYVAAEEHEVTGKYGGDLTQGALAIASQATAVTIRKALPIVREVTADA